MTGKGQWLATNLATDAIVRTSTGEAVAFWVLGVLAVIGALGRGDGRQRRVLGDVLWR